MIWQRLWSLVSHVLAAIAARFSPTVPPNVPPLPVPNIEEPEPIPPPKRDLLNEFCLYIQSREGYFAPGQNKLYPKGTPAWRNNNPGNIKYGAFAMSCGATGKDASGFAKFPTYEIGFAALKSLVTNAAQGKMKSYKPTMTLVQFFSAYAPAEDNNDPVSYAREVGFKLDVDYRTFQIKDLL